MYLVFSICFSIHMLSASLGVCVNTWKKTHCLCGFPRGPSYSFTFLSPSLFLDRVEFTKINPYQEFAQLNVHSVN